MLFELMGTIGSLIVCMSAFPQIAKTYRTKKADDISISYLLILMAGITLMTVYALHIGDPVFIFGNILSVASTGILIFLWLRYRGPGMDKQD
jgi:MtN3 and saliva related transmembrane protein